MNKAIEAIKLHLKDKTAVGWSATSTLVLMKEAIAEESGCILIPKDLLKQLVISHARLGTIEYKRNSSYNDSHFHYKAENAICNFYIDKYPEEWEALLKEVSMYRK